METPKIHAALCQIQSEVAHVPKNRRNSGQGYLYRGIDDFCLAVQRVMARCGVHVYPVRLDVTRTAVPTKSGGSSTLATLDGTWRFTCAEDGSSIDVEGRGEALDVGDKSTGKAISYALKYVLRDVFLLPTDDPDEDTEADQPPERSATATADEIASALASLDGIPEGERCAWVSWALRRYVGSLAQVRDHNDLNAIVSARAHGKMPADFPAVVVRWNERGAL